MFIPVVLSDGQEDSVSKDELQFLMDVHQVLQFKRSDGWVVVGQDKMRDKSAPYKEDDCREHEDFSVAHNEVFSLDA